ncbi:hypothetical protein R1sor_005069 [Riccia sorocarpa]|uniref:Uncharacterized protein n=1 Tax=Riccia sorocarpa TaxID=122646 RepID=A0ABD3HJ12_9MARC
MATSSRGDKGKAPMVEQEDIGTEEEELLDLHPPLPEHVGRSGSDRKRKKSVREEECPLADGVRQKSEKSLFIVPGLTMRNDEEKKKCKRTAELWAQWFKPQNSLKDHACTSVKYKACESMSYNTIRFISMDNFTRMDETTRLGVRGAGRTHRVGIVDEELVQVLGNHEVVHYALKVLHRPQRDTKIHEKCIREMAFPESHPAIICPIGISKDKNRPMLSFPLWNGDMLEMYINLEKSSR